MTMEIMCAETAYLIELTAAFLRGETVTLRADIDYRKLCGIARAHNLIAVVYAVCNKAPNTGVIPEDCRLAVSEHFFSSVFLYEHQKQGVERVYRILSDADIPHVFFKGSILKELYPVPECRLMGDIDLLIRPAHRQAAKQALMSSGFACTAQNGPVYDYRQGDVLLEVHTALISDDPPGEGAFADAMDHAQFEGCCGRLEDSYHFAYLIAHLAHHFRFYGAGIKLILDLAVMLQRCQIDEKAVLTLCEKAGLAQFAKIVLTVCYRWYGVGKAYVDDTADCEAFLVSYGAFGNDHRNKSAVIARRQLAQGEAVGPLRSKLRLAFPSYKQMQHIPYIRFLDGRPWLTPYAWCYRLIYNTRHRKDFMMRTARGLDDDDAYAAAKKELEFLKEMGLL